MGRLNRSVSCLGDFSGFTVSRLIAYGPFEVISEADVTLVAVAQSAKSVFVLSSLSLHY